MSSTITYLTDVHPDAVFSRKNVPRRGMMGLAPGQGQDGYGRKITSDYMVTIGKRQYRVYAICISNCASHYVTVGGQKMFLRGCDIPDEVRQAEAMDELVAELPEEFQQYVRSESWSRGHASGLENVLSIAQELVSDLAPVVAKYTKRILK